MLVVWVNGFSFFRDVGGLVLLRRKRWRKEEGEELLMIWVIWVIGGNWIVK